MGEQPLLEQHTASAFACPKKVPQPSTGLVPAPPHRGTPRARCWVWIRLQSSCGLHFQMQVGTYSKGARRCFCQHDLHLLHAWGLKRWWEQRHSWEPGASGAWVVVDSYSSISCPRWRSCTEGFIAVLRLDKYYKFCLLRMNQKALFHFVSLGLLFVQTKVREKTEYIISSWFLKSIW